MRNYWTEKVFKRFKRCLQKVSFLWCNRITRSSGLETINCMKPDATFVFLRMRQSKWFFLDSKLMVTTFVHLAWGCTKCVYKLISPMIIQTEGETLTDVFLLGMYGRAPMKNWQPCRQETELGSNRTEQCVSSSDQQVDESRQQKGAFRTEKISGPLILANISEGKCRFFFFFFFLRAMTMSMTQPSHKFGSSNCITHSRAQRVQTGVLCQKNKANVLTGIRY